MKIHKILVNEEYENEKNSISSPQKLHNELNILNPNKIFYVKNESSY